MIVGCLSWLLYPISSLILQFFHKGCMFSIMCLWNWHCFHSSMTDIMVVIAAITTVMLRDTCKKFWSCDCRSGWFCPLPATGFFFFSLSSSLYRFILSGGVLSAVFNLDFARAIGLSSASSSSSLSCWVVWTSGSSLPSGCQCKEMVIVKPK